jgi:hypothetical protein
MHTLINILVIVSYILYIFFSSLNLMDNYSTESIEKFKNERNNKIIVATIIMLLILI